MAHLIAKGGQTATGAALRALSPVDVVALGPCGKGHTEAFLRHLWRPDDWLYLFSVEHPASGIPGRTLRRQREWLDLLSHGPVYCDGIVPNPFSGEPVARADGTSSYITGDCLARYPYVLVEFDDMPLGRQCALWRGFLNASGHRNRLAALTYSGGKSIHALIRIDAGDLLAQTHWRFVLTNLFAGSPDRVLCAVAGHWMLKSIDGISTSEIWRAKVSVPGRRYARHGLRRRLPSLRMS
ncbi:MAG: hypothetical protein Q4G65_16130 [bacterium]|nr:hypothetical protein [bacterium]